MSVELIDQLLGDPDPAFACYANGDSAKKETFVVPVEHLANPPTAEASLTSIPHIPGSMAAKDFYAAHDGVLLYTASETFETGIEIFPLAQWKQRTAQMVESWVAESDLYPNDDMPYGHNDFIAFAHCRGASSYVHWVTRGPHAGSVYWWAWTMRPEKTTPPTARNFSEFLQLIYQRPVHSFNELFLGFTRFSDGRTATEWIPSRYLPDRRSSQNGR